MLTGLKTFALRAVRTTIQHAPEILMVLGTIGVAGGTAITVKQTMKLDGELLEFDDAQEELKARKAEFPDEKAYKKELMMIKLAAAKRVVKILAPGIIPVAAGVVCYFSAFGIIKRANGVLAVELAAANKAFEEYRARVVEDQGEDKDKEYLYGLKKEQLEIETVDENGKKKKEKVDALVLDPDKSNISRYAIRFTPEFSSEASTDLDYNMMVLTSCQNSWNALLPARKKVWLSEIYHELGIEETQESRIAGWDYDADKFGDGKIMFIITQVVVRDDNDPRGWHKELIVDFNVDGDILHKLPKSPQLLGMEVEDHVECADQMITYF